MYRADPRHRPWGSPQGESRGGNLFCRRFLSSRLLACSFRDALWTHWPIEAALNALGRSRGRKSLIKENPL